MMIARDQNITFNALHKESMIVACCFGVVGFVDSLLILITIIKSSTLRTKCFITIANLAAVDAVCGLSFVWVNIYTLHLHGTNGSTEFVSGLSCALASFPLNWSTRLSRVMTLTSGVDRLLAVIFPIPYKTVWKRTYTVCLNGSAWLLSSLSSGLCLIWIVPDASLEICDAQSAFSFQLAVADDWINGTIGGLILMIYSISSLLLFRRMKMAKAKGAAEYKKTNRLHDVAAFKTIAAIVVLSVVLLFLPDVIFGSFDILEDSAPVTDLLQCVFSTSHFFVYYSMCKDFRQAFRKTVLKQKMQILPAVIISNKRS